MRYSDVQGAITCKTCPLGTIPGYRPWSYTSEKIICKPCGQGWFGKSDGKCYRCKEEGPMKYSGIETGAPSCKTCPLGHVPDGFNVVCKACAAGTFGKMDGKCHECAVVGPMAYSDVEGSTYCKTCPLGSIPEYESRCRPCHVGTFGKTDGHCHDCKEAGPMRYSNVTGAWSCQTCPVGTSPYWTIRPTKCKPCLRGFVGKSNGCKDCKNDGPMKYSDSIGATICKTCSLGQYPVPNSQPNRCHLCSKGEYGKSDGQCYNCKPVGPMKYSDIQGATECKTCPLGRFPIHNPPFYCDYCQLGTYGKSDGKCYKCTGPMSYTDARGSVSCKTCQVGYQAYRSGPGREYQIGCLRCPWTTIGTKEGCLRPDQVNTTTVPIATSRGSTRQQTTTEESRKPSSTPRPHTIITKSTSHATNSPGSSQETTQPSTHHSTRIHQTIHPHFTTTGTIKSSTQPRQPYTTPPPTDTPNDQSTTDSNFFGNEGKQTSSASSANINHFLVVLVLLLVIYLIL
ncbi:laminin subunit gamma-3-like [Clytia hemisphaerica]